MNKKLKLVIMVIIATLAIPFITVYMLVIHPSKVWDEFRKTYKKEGLIGFFK